MKAIPVKGILTAWGRILLGKAPALSIEITRECPLQCPGCYAYGDEHLNGDTTLRQLHDFKGQELVERVLALVDQHRPVQVSIVGGEPLVRYRELGDILPALAARDIYVQLVTSAVREIPREWRALPKLTIVVSIDGLQPEHDVRRTPATYERILKHIAGHSITVHCTVTRQQVNREGYIEEFLQFWSAREAVSKIWVSLYTPQLGEASAERLLPSDREKVIADLLALSGAGETALRLDEHAVVAATRSDANRLANADEANVKRTVRAAQQQLEAIKQLDVDALPRKLQEIAVLRRKHPALSLAELAKKCRPPITKAAAHHRMAALRDLAADN